MPLAVVPTGLHFERPRTAPSPGGSQRTGFYGLLFRLRFVRSGDGVRRPRGWQRCAPPPAAARGAVPAYLCSEIDAFSNGDTSQQPNTHNRALGEIHYPWHPWHGRRVVVYAALSRKGGTVVRCGLEDESQLYRLEVPSWMLDAEKCNHLRLAESGAVSIEALRVLKELLHSVSSGGDIVVQAQHHCQLSSGGADANVIEPSPERSASTVSSPTPDTPLGRSAARCAAEHSAAAGRTAAPAGRWAAGGRSSKGGV